MSAAGKHEMCSFTDMYPCDIVCITCLVVMSADSSGQSRDNSVFVHKPMCIHGHVCVCVGD